MTLYEISLMQKELDAHILQNHELRAAETFRKRILAFLVELGELANETRCFKYWSKKSSSKADVVLDEYVDGIHFLVSLGNDMEIDFTNVAFVQETEEEINASEAFLDVYGLASDFSRLTNASSFRVLFQSYVRLCFALGFTFEDVVAGYVRKNQINHERQDTNY